jgi:hypothetical protein
MTGTPEGPGGWQARTSHRLMKLGYAGFTFDGASTSWWPVGTPAVPTAGPFHSPEEFDAWLDGQERLQREAIERHQQAAGLAVAPDEVTTFIISQMIRLDTPALTRIRDSITVALLRPKPWKRDTDLRRIREAMDDELAERSRPTQVESDVRAAFRAQKTPQV